MTQPLHVDRHDGREGIGIATRYAGLMDQHRELEAALRTELARPRADDARLREVKRAKLQVKDELFAIERLLAAIGVDPAAMARAA